MGKDEMKEQLYYLEEERKKIWSDLTDLKQQFIKLQNSLTENMSFLREDILSSIPKDLAELKQSCKKSTEYKNKIISNFNETSKKIEEINNTYTDFLNKNKLIDDAILKINEVSSKGDDLKKLEESLQKGISENQETSNNLSKKVIDAEQLFSDIEEKGETVNETFEKIDNLLQQSLKLKTEIATKHQKIFGYKTVDKNSGEETFVQGTLGELDNCYKNTQMGFQKLKEEFESFKEKEKLETNNIKNKIKALLPDAMTAGLSGAFEEKRKSENMALTNATQTFSRLLWAMAIIALIPFGIYVYWLYIGKELDFVIGNTLNVSIAFLPLYAPFVWLAIHLNKKINLSKKLIEEYCYKETISKTVEGLSNQIKQIDDGKTSKLLHTKLLTLLLETSADNPGKYITQYDKCDNPAIELLTRLEKMSHLNIKAKGMECKIQMDKENTPSEQADK